jgi:hypothetical protein
LRWSIWDDDEIEPCYQQNLLLAYNPDAYAPTFGLRGPLDVVHPRIWAWKA